MKELKIWGIFFAITIPLEILEPFSRHNLVALGVKWFIIGGVLMYLLRRIHV